jgi:hypothetical protein
VDFFLFPRLTSIMKGARFADVAAIQERVTAVLRPIPKEALADSFQKLYERCQQCFVKDSDYFKGQQSLFVCIFCFVCFLVPFTEFLDKPRKITTPNDSETFIFVKMVEIKPTYFTLWTGIASRRLLDSLGNESRWGTRFSAPVQTDPGARSAFYTIRTGSNSWW